jgi:membrane protein
MDITPRDRRDEAQETGLVAPEEAAAAGERRGWLDLLKGYFAVHVARSADRVLENRAAARREHGRLGGEVSAAARPRPGTISLARSEGSEAPPAAEPGSDTGTSQRNREACEARDEGFLATAKIAFKEFGRDKGTLMAAAVTFYMLLSLVPLIVVAIAVFGYILGGNVDAQARVFQFLGGFFSPQQMATMREGVQGVIEQRGTIALSGLAALAFTASGGFATLDTAINVTWGTPNRSFLKNKLFAFGMMFLIGGLFILSFALTAAVGIATEFAGHLPMVGGIAENPVVRFLLGALVPFAISGLMFSAIYYLFPNTKNKAWKPALTAGFITAFLWEIFKHAYTWWTSSSLSGDQAATYGSLAGFIGLIMWIYYSSALILLGSELTWAMSGCPGEKPDPPIAPDEKEV